MPVGRRTNRNEVRAIAMVAAALVLILGGLVAFVTFLSARGDVEIRLGDDRFNAGNALDIAEAVAEQGPILFSDPSGGRRDIMINHLSDDPLQGWVAFDARLPGDDRNCQVRWRPEAGSFAYNCDPALTFPPDGEGLTSYPVSVVDGRIIVDINAAARASTTTAPGPRSSVVISGS